MINKYKYYYKCNVLNNKKDRKLNLIFSSIKIYLFLNI